MTTKKTPQAKTSVDTAVAAGKETFEKMTKVSQETAEKNMEQAAKMQRCVMSRPCLHFQFC